MFEIKENKLNITEYAFLRDSVSWKKLSEQQLRIALEKSIVTFCAYDGDKPVGMGRIVGDGAVICYIQELVVHPDYQGQGIGKALMEKLIAYVENLRLENTEMMLCLMCAKGREEFYRKCGFTARPTDNLGPGMIMYLK